MRNLSKTMLAVVATGLLSCGLFCQQADAFTGNILFTGIVQASGPSGTGHMTHLTFTNPWTVASAPAPDGAYAGTAGSSATMTNFTFTGTGTGAVLVGGTVVNEWSFSHGGNTYSFDLVSLISATITHGTIDMSGTGIARINGGDASAATWALQGTGRNFTFSFASSSTSAVPDGGSAGALLGIAFAGIEIVRRKIKAA
jgi:VPDSG-CTERM motif